MPGMNAQLLTDSEATAVRIREALDATLGAAELGPAASSLTRMCPS